MDETISAVVDEGFIGDDDDDEYEDLYNDVNVGENFLQTVNQTNDIPKQEQEKHPKPLEEIKNSDEVKIERDEVKIERDDVIDSKVSDPVEEVKKSVERINDVAPSGMRINLGQPVEQPPVVNTNNNISNQVLVANNVVNARQVVNVNGGGHGGSGAMLFVGDLHWWTTDAEVEAELCKYGMVKEVRFFDEKASGKSKGYAQVEFFDPSAAAASKDGMNGFVFNGRACVVAFASPFSIKRMGEAQVNRTTQGAVAQGPVRRDGPLGNSNNKPMGLGNNTAPMMGDNNNSNNNNNNNNGFGNRGFGRGNWGRGNGQGMGSRGPIRGRGMMGRGMMGNGFGAGPPMLPPQAMMGQGFDPSFGGPMGRMTGYGGFPMGPTPPFFPPVGNVGLPGVAPHVNPAFFGRGMGMNGMGMSVEGNNNMGMWNDPNMGGWGGDEHGGRVAESSYAEEAVSDHQYGEVSRAGRPNAMKEKDRGSEREWFGSSDKRYRDDREHEYEREIPKEKEASHDQEWQERRHRDERDVSREKERSRDHDRGRDRHRDEKGDKYVDHHRYKDREPEYDDEWERGRSSRTHNKSRLSQEEGQHFRSREGDYSKRRRLTSE